MRKHDLTRRAPNAGNREGGHVSDASEKGALRTMLLDEAVGVAGELRRLRERLHYIEQPSPGGSTGGGGAAARRRWAWTLATMVAIQQGA